MARATCVYCGAALSAQILEEANLAAERVLKSKSLAHLEAAAKGHSGNQPPKRYLVADTSCTSAQILAQAASVSPWEARQWQAASRYRLLRITSEAEGSSLEARLEEMGVPCFSIPERIVAPARSPIPIESVDRASSPLQCSLRHSEESAPAQAALLEDEVALVISASIKRERVREQQASRRTRAETRLEDILVVHIHLKAETRPLEIDPRRTGFEGGGLASAHMGTLELVRRLSTTAAHDTSFRNAVPALSPAEDTSSDFAGLKKPIKPGAKEPKVVVLDNLAQFREYSAWRGAVEKERRSRLQA